MRKCRHVGSRALADELGADGEGVIISQVVPFPWDDSVPLVADYQKALKAHDAAAEPGFVSLEGYVVGRLTVEAMQAAGADLTRDGFLKAVQSMNNLDLGGLAMSFGADDNQGLENVFLTEITADGGFTPIDTSGGNSTN